MAKVVITLTDTDAGTVDVQFESEPACELRPDVDMTKAQDIGYKLSTLLAINPYTVSRRSAATRCVIRNAANHDLYWSNTWGWGGFEGCTVFSDTDYGLPIGGEWVNAACIPRAGANQDGA